MIVVGGEALVDLVPGESEVDSRVGGGLTSLLPRLGGGPYNVALAAGRLGAPVGFLSRVSTDRFGKALRERLTDSGVDVSLLQDGPEPTTLAVVTLDAGTAAYSFYTEGTADRLVTDPGPLPSDVTTLCVGTLGMVLEPGATVYETVLRREAARGVLTALDPNIRGALIADAAAYRERFASWLPDVRLLKLSDDDASWLTEGADPDEAAKGWLDAGVDAVVLTRGGDGIAVHTAAGSLSVPSARAELVDTIGAGDTVQGALLAWLHERDVRAVTQLEAADWRAALGYAASAAAITVSRSGAEPPTAAEMV